MKNKKWKVWKFVLAVIFVFSCDRQNISSNETETQVQVKLEKVNSPDTELLRRAREVVAAMDNKELAAQVIMTGIDGCGDLSESEIKRLTLVPAGAIMLFKKNLKTNKESVKFMLDKVIDTYGEIKPFIAVDHEGGTVQRFANDIPRLRAPYSYWEASESYGEKAALEALLRDSEASARILRHLGITMNLAPVAEVITRENEAFLGTRSYGQNANFVAAACAVFITGMNNAGIACVVKHFPGNSGEDPHLRKPIITNSESELLEMTESFSAVMRSKPSGVMVSHAIVENWDNAHNASLSEIVIKEKLRKEFAFTGIVFADDFSMGAVSGSFSVTQAAVRSLASGADMVMCWPRNLYDIHDAILQAVQEKALKQERLQEAAEHIVYEKLRIGIIE